jgi:hypothetical protein
MIIPKKYSVIRDEIQTGDLFFTAGNGIFSRAIRFFTRSKVSHTGIFVWLEKRLFVVESMESFGVRILPASDLFLRGGEVFFGHLPRRKSAAWIKSRIFGNSKNLPKIGEKYDLLGALTAMVFDTKSARVFCSEYVGKILDLKFPASNSGITPDDIAARCGKNFSEIEK